MKIKSNLPQPSFTEAADEDHEVTEAKMESFSRESVLAGEEASDPDQYPRMWNVSAGFFNERVVRTHQPQPVEIIAIPHRTVGGGDRNLELLVAISRWNMIWEAAQYRRRHFGPEDLPFPLYEIADRGDNNIVFVPETESRYHEYAPIYHLISRGACERHGLPLLRGGQWPFLSDLGVDRYLPSDFAARLGRAWASAVWYRFVGGSSLSAFSRDDSLKLLAHNLDFWQPAIVTVMEDILRELPVSAAADPEEGFAKTQDGLVVGTYGPARMGGDIWRGEEETKEVIESVIARADASGKLRAIIDAIKSNRVEDDFSDRWSHAREDFERKLYHKRAKVRVRFVELTDSLPVQSRHTEVSDGLVLGDFMSLLDPKERQIVVLVSSGVTRVGEVASILGYANHSPVSKRLTRIRQKAAAYFFE
jgi:hypothetical protein